MSNKIRLATVFSGIGAVEFAFKRLSLRHDIIFACDNGDINLSNLDYEKEFKNVKSLKSGQEKNTYVKNIYRKESKRTNFIEKTYKANYKIDDKDYFYDAKLLDGTDFKEKVDFFVGGSPCQSFSIAGARAGFEDTRGTLFYDYARLINEIKPKVFLYENVYGLLTHDRGKTWKIMRQVFSSLDYHYKFSCLDARDYNIPQGRRRIFVVGFREKNFYELFDFPKAKKLEYTMQDFLLDNCKFGDFTYKKNSDLSIKKSKGEMDEKLFLSPLLKKYVLSPGTKNFYHEDSEIDLKVARAILSTQGNSHRASVNNYVTTDGKIRALDPRESLRLMGFTDDFKMTVSKSQSYKQSGNSIVVDVLINIIKEILKTGVFDGKD